MEAALLVSEGRSSDPRILLIENETESGEGFVGAFELVGIQVAWAKDAISGLAMRGRLLPDIILVGLRLQDINSVDLVAQLVERRDCGVIVLAGLDDEAARVESLECGADDYLAKPDELRASDLRDIVARVRAVHRRVNLRGEAPATVDTVLSVGPIRINLRHRTVHTADGRRLGLTSAEYTALETLARAEGTAVSRDRLSETALRRPWRAEDRSVDQLVFNLRQKLPTDGEGGMLIQSIRGSGYWMRAPDRPTRRRPEFGWLSEESRSRPTPAYRTASA